MKILPAFLPLLMLLAVNTLNAQMLDGKGRIGVKAGVNGSSLYDDSQASNLKSRLGMTAGVFAQISLGPSRKWSLRPELLFTTKGGAYDYVNGTRTDFKVNYVELPLMLEYHLFGFLDLHAGGFASTLASADGTIGGSVATLGKGNFEKYDYGWLAGAGIDLGSLGLHFRISHGLQKVGTPSVQSILGDVKNAAWALTLSYGL